MKTQSSFRKMMTGVIGAFALVLLTAPANHAKLIIAGDFPVAGVKASELPADSLFDLLLADYEEDAAQLENGDFLDLVEIFFGY